PPSVPRHFSFHISSNRSRAFSSRSLSMRVPFAVSFVVVLGGLFGWLTASGLAPVRVVAQEKSPASATLDRTVLPIPEPKIVPSTELDVRNAKAPPRFQVKAPDGAPNVLIILIDDMGFGQSSASAGPAPRPT